MSFYTEQDLISWARINRKAICREFFGRKTLSPTTEKIAVFMAGSPGAGKTEFISRLLTDNYESAYYTLDLDEIRTWMPGYRGKYSDIYTRGALKILESMIDTCNRHGYNFILDGTFTSTEVIDKNFERLLAKKYTVNIFYIHTQPYIAWYYTLLREYTDGRRVPKERFIRDYYLAREMVSLKKQKYGDQISVFVADKRKNKLGEVSTIEVYETRDLADLKSVLDKNARPYYNVGKGGDIFFFIITSSISKIPLIGKHLFRCLGYLAKIPTRK